MAWSVRGRSANVWAPSVFRGSRERPSIALTFDDGPSDGTAELLELLAVERVRATFFQCGMNVERHPEVCRRVAAQHEIGNHSYSHPRFYFRSPEFIAAELEHAQAAITRIAGAAPTLFRAPYGIRWPGMRAAQRRLALLGVMWTVIGYDWRLPAGAVVKRVMRGIGNGAIICLHDGRAVSMHPDIRETLAAVRRLIPMLRDRGFQFETVSQLLCPTN